MVFPIILGEGKRVVPGCTRRPATLRLTGSRTVGDGVLLLTDEPAVQAA